MSKQPDNERLVTEQEAMKPTTVVVLVAAVLVAYSSAAVMEGKNSSGRCSHVTVRIYVLRLKTAHRPRPYNFDTCTLAQKISTFRENDAYIILTICQVFCYHAQAKNFYALQAYVPMVWFIRRAVVATERAETWSQSA